MSTRGIFSIKKDSIEKVVDIAHDAHPDGAGADILDLIKTTDLNVLYDTLILAEEWEDDDDNNPNEIAFFSYDAFRLAVKRKEKLWIDRMTRGKNRNPTDCEYAYVIDLDRSQLSFFVGGQFGPREGNKDGTVTDNDSFMKQPYYPCRLAAVFSLAFIRCTGMAQLIKKMRQAVETESVVKFYINDAAINEGNSVEEEQEKEQYNYSGKKRCCVEVIRKLECRLKKARAEIPNLYPVYEKRISDLLWDVILVSKTVELLEERIEIIR